ncbi:MAG: DEAD/DEAH box helicase [Phycisphaeraceae bacterium]
MTRTVTPPLAQLLHDYFSSNARSKGMEYFVRNAVTVLTMEPDLIEAQVAGGEQYQVAIEYDEPANELAVSCACPAFDREGTCKHLWAVLKTADAEGGLSAARANGCHNLVRELESVTDDDYADDGNFRFEPRAAEKRPAPAPPKAEAWTQALAAVSRRHVSSVSSGFWIAGRQVLYIIDIGRCFQGQPPAVEIAVQDRKQNGEWSKPRVQRLSRTDIYAAPDPRDRKVLEALLGLRKAEYGYSSYGYGFDELVSPVALNAGLMQFAFSLLCDTGRCWLRRTDERDAELIRLTWDDGPAWDVSVQVKEKDANGNYRLTGTLRRDGQDMPLTAANLILRGGVMVVGETAVRFNDEYFEWIAMLRDGGGLSVPHRDGQKLAAMLATMPRRVPVQMPEHLRIEEVSGSPRPKLRLFKATRYGRATGDRMQAGVQFDYEGKFIGADHADEALLIDQPRQLIRRDRDAEAAALELLASMGFRPMPAYDRDTERQLEVKLRKLHAALSPLVAAGWRVEAEGKPYRSAGAIQLKVASGIDWFELSGQAQFDDQTIELPLLLEALRRKENTVTLGDGTIGMLPEEWLKKYGTLAALGNDEGDHIRFGRTQVGLLDALLAAMPEATCDEVFHQARERLRRFAGVKPVDAPPGFGGELRPYQCEGLGWLQFLREFRFGGCLADDMGLGKTIQVLAMLDARRLEKEAARNEKDDAVKGASSLPRPSLVVVPRSLVFNWQSEASKFTPELRVLDHTGIDRICRGEGDHAADLGEYDLILITYGTLRADAAKLKDVKFDYLILDEAQAVKNAGSASAKAVRLLDGEHRLVMTGTPVENRLSDLWSLFEFLNPGMLGSASVFKLLGGGGDSDSGEARALLSKALRPFILRRKKEQVARDLPARFEQTLYCELEPKQRKLYNQLREHYRKSLLGKVDKDGLNKSKMHVLEALLRLRQAACHPGLIDDARKGEASAKLDALLPQLQEVIDEGHKVLVFSQFTSLLAIVRQRLDAEKITYEYLDGQTRDRQARVERFQNDPACPVFLISLKAGGSGLNLTAADYVFLLDPWWNPAVEAQAVDRAHRIGQSKQVFAYRLIARDTVEEKVLELQNSKRDLADAIISEDNSLISKLGRAELELLLS